MSILALAKAHLPAMSLAAVDRVREAEKVIALAPQAPLCTHHLIHAGVYHRTILVPAHHVMTGVLIKIPTALTLSGHVRVHIGDEVMEMEGYHVLPAYAHRKQAFVTLTDTHMTMSFATSAKTLEEAEAEFTDEVDLLVSRRDQNLVVITGD